MVKSVVSARGSRCEIMVFLGVFRKRVRSLMALRVFLRIEVVAVEMRM